VPRATAAEVEAAGIKPMDSRRLINQVAAEPDGCRHSNVMVDSASYTELTALNASSH
jgi:hypothetical protein